MGHPFGFLIKNEDLTTTTKSSTAFFPIMEMGANVPFIHSILSSSLMQVPAGPKPEDKVGWGAIVSIKERQGPAELLPQARLDQLEADIVRETTRRNRRRHRPRGSFVPGGQKSRRSSSPTPTTLDQGGSEVLATSEWNPDQISLPENIKIHGVRIHSGTSVGLSYHHMTTRKDFFGPDAATFRSER
ncbi:uncharacterized protein Z518_00358 [Rhinocladiella mackenziei CBS 650.93]|uniref:Uncharacterized protein n=1 Tax=Rhinocladiella mackenziei CBS 650.93 TaxID=1442369 RepID=A0A0D2IT99_9EURO|nr:uncharacterized protein Z518_00358 [Rhinocladiella mackenziei CBS 650.93]KIX09279.1 hypothetical protein Z518_00358 [Rhinocladiella mackenziei CBS 650.93]